MKFDRIAIFGFADATEDDSLYRDVKVCAQILAKNGITIVNGGGPGVMRAATQGAHLGGGKVIGVTFYPKQMQFEGKDPQNKVDEEVITQNYVERTLRLLERGQIYLIFNGGTGTISEFGMSWGLAKLYFGHHKPLILYGGFWNEIIGAFKKNMKLREEELRVFKIVNSPHEILDAIEQFSKEIEAGEHPHFMIDAKGEGAFRL